MKKLGMLDDDILYWENEGFKFYVNWATQNLTNKAREMNIKGIELRGWMVLVAESKKDGCRTYLLVDSDGQPRRDSTTFEGMALEIDFMKMAKREDYDIVVMAEKRNGQRNRRKEGKRKLKQ